MSDTIVIEVQSGCVYGVYGLPEGWDYIVADYDDCDDEEEEYYDEAIGEAKARDNRALCL